jgi:hypothetical protein
VSARLLVRSTATAGKKSSAAAVMVIETACNNSNLFFFFGVFIFLFPLRRLVMWKGKKNKMEALTCAMRGFEKGRQVKHESSMKK